MRLQERENERGDLIGELRICLASQRRELRTLDGIEQTELRLDHAWVRLVSAEFGRDCLVQVDHVLNAEVAHACVSR